MREILHQAFAANLTVPRKYLVVVLYVQWNDDFDPKSSIKATIGVVWIKILIFVSETFHLNKIDDTYPISIGLKKIATIVLNPHL